MLGNGDVPLLRVYRKGGLEIPIASLVYDAAS